MMRNRAGRIVAMVVMGILFIGVGGFVVMHLWNWLLPMLFGWRVLTFWQALGLLLLCRILFGSMGGHRGGGGRFRRRMAERWNHMTPEERERFRHEMRCGPFRGEATGESKA